ncbi:MAG: RMD1 family protein [Ignavibacteria bacterium]|nr:RMD1 family protein [Ignavibacteria bacterium]
MKNSINAFQVAEQLQIKAIKKNFAGTLVSGNSYELFYKLDTDSYLYIFDYGVIVFSNCDEVEMSRLLDYLRQFTVNEFEQRYSEDFTILIEESGLQFSFNELRVSKVTEDLLKMVMLNVGQSVALDYYSDMTQRLLDDNTTVIASLEKTGKLHATQKQLLRFIGQSMNIRTRIIDNIYILDEPETIWENEELNKINQGLRETFDLRTRFRDLDYKLQLVKDNLELFTELAQHNESKRLEWIVIILIFIEVGNLLLSFIFKGLPH